MTVRQRTLDADPLEEEAPPAPCKCEDGWVTVLPAYGERLFPFPDPPPEDASDETWLAFGARYEQARTSRIHALNTVYPCRVHRDSTFFRWAAGCFAPNHDRRSCSECVAAKGKR